MTKIIMKSMAFFITAFALVVVQSQLSNNSSVLARSFVPCCNAGQCHQLNCNEPSGVVHEPGCSGNETFFTCSDCLDKEATGGQECTWTNNVYCVTNGVKYYGNSQWGISAVSINGPSSVRKAGSYSVSVTGGSGSYSYQWSVSFDGGSYQDLGTGSTQRLEFDTQCTATLRCVVIDNNHTYDQQEGSMGVTNQDC
jgi:hypothetical protein